MTTLTLKERFKSPTKRMARRAVLSYSVHNRRRKAERILKWMSTKDIHDVLLIGTMGDEHVGNPNMVNAGIVETKIAAEYPIKMSINIEPTRTSYPFTMADARDMPFEDGYVDFALANAIIEHVGAEEEQRRMVEEMTRVARAWVITTPNRWFPIESHTTTVLRHWIPAWRNRRNEFTRLLSRREFRALLPNGAKVNGGPWSPTFTAYFTC